MATQETDHPKHPIMSRLQQFRPPYEVVQYFQKFSEVGPSNTGISILRPIGEYVLFQVVERARQVKEGVIYSYHKSRLKKPRL